MTTIDYDTELQLHHQFLQKAHGIKHTDHVVDIGCGEGLTTRDAARLASSGSAFGIDISADMITEARSKSAADGITNITFEEGDAEVYPFAPGSFDVAISRFGTMFFADPAAAFVNIARSLRAGGRLAMLVWQSYNRNEWAMSIDHALNVHSAGHPRTAGTSDPFSLGDPAVLTQILADAGFQDCTLVDVDAPVYYGSNPDAALGFVSQFADVKERLFGDEPDPGFKHDASVARERLRSLMAEHDTGRGVWFDSRSWLVTAQRA